MRPHRLLAVPISVALVCVGACSDDSGDPALEGISHISEMSSPVPMSPPDEGAIPSAEASVTAVPTTPSASPTRTPTPQKTPSPNASPSPDDRPTSDGSEKDRIERLETAVIALTNDERRRHGCDAVESNDKLHTAARGHSLDMAERDYFSHTTPEGDGPGDRATDAGYETWGAENIAMGYPNADAVMTGWMNSEGHRANILNCDLTEIGIGVADSPRGLYWTQMFGYG